MTNRYRVQVNEEVMDLTEFQEVLALPERIHTLRLDFNDDRPEGINNLALIITLYTLLQRVKDKSEYSLMLENLASCMLLIKKLAIEQDLGDDRY